MIRPIAVATAGYLTGDGRFVLSAAVDGWLTKLVVSMGGSPKKGKKRAPWVRPISRPDDPLAQDDEDILAIIIAIAGGNR